MSKKKIVIIGAGFGGLTLARTLRHNDIETLLIDKNNYHTFQPLLYQVATGGLEPDSIAYPIRRILRRRKNVKYRMADVLNIDPATSTLETSIGSIGYDFLVIATGSTNNFFNFEPIQEKLLPLKSITDALDIRSFVMQNLEKVLTISDLQQQEQIVNVSIIGGGPAGIELAGALAEMKAKLLPKDFPEFNFDKMHIYLFEAGGKLLANMSETASLACLEYMKEMNINVLLNSKVESFDGNLIVLGDKREYYSNTVIWTAGVQGELIKGLDKAEIIKGRRIRVNELNQVIHYSNIYAIGDIAACPNELHPYGLPMLASAAIQQGKHLAKNLVCIAKNKKTMPFVFKDKGVMATIGRNRAVVDFPKWKFHGRFAWFLWMSVHLIVLLGFRNKLVTLIDWVQNYFSYDRPLGLIIRKYHRKT